MHRDTKKDYTAFLANMQIDTHDSRSEYELARVLMAGTHDCISEILCSIESEDIYELAVQKIYETVKMDFERGFTYEGMEQFSHMTTAYFDVFNGKNVVLNPTYMGRMMDFMDVHKVPNESKMRMCIESVKRKRVLRDTIHALYAAVDMCAHDESGVEKAYEHIRNLVYSHEGKEESDELSHEDFTRGLLGTVYEYNDPEKRKKKSINVGWPMFQRITGGFGAEELIIVSARSGDGKSAFSLNVAADVGVFQRIPTLYINSELSDEQMQMRYMSYAAHVDSKKIREGDYYDEKSETKLNAKVEQELVKQQARFCEGELRFRRIPDLQISNIERAIYTDHQKRGTRLVIVDYLGRMDITKTAGVAELQEWQIMRLAATRLKTLAQKYHLCIIMVCQLTDGGTLQGARAIKNECDMWMSINRLKNSDDMYMDKRLADIFPYNTILKIEKARNVSDSSAVKYRYEGAMMRFCDTLEGIKDMIDKNSVYGKYSNELVSPLEYQRICNMIKENQTAREFSCI